MPNPLDLAAIEARCEKATEGPWTVEEDTDAFVITDSGSEVCSCYVYENPASTNDDNATFIAHARTDIPALLAEVRALAESDAEHVAMMQEEHKRRVEAEAEVRRLQDDNERMRRGVEAVRAWNERDRHGVALSRGLDNLLAGREWSEGE